MGSSSPASQGDLQNLGMAPLGSTPNTAGTSPEGLELQGGGFTSAWVKEGSELPKAPCLLQEHLIRGGPRQSQALVLLHSQRRGL